MTNEKNNIKNLVSDDDDPTEELEIIVPPAGHEPDDVELETDAVTFNQDDPSADRDRSTRMVASLEHHIRLRDENIDRLQYDFEQLRLRWVGLDKELSVREKITETINAELNEAKKELADSQRRLHDRDTEIDLLAGRITKHEKAESDAIQLVDSLVGSLGHREQRIKELEGLASASNSEVAGLTAHLDELQGRFTEAEIDLQQAKDQLSVWQQRFDDQQSENTNLAGKLSDHEKTLREADLLIESLKDSLGIHELRVKELEEQAIGSDRKVADLADQLEQYQLRATTSAQEVDARELKIHEVSRTLQETTERANTLAERLTNQESILQQTTIELESKRQLIDRVYSTVAQVRQESGGLLTDGKDLPDEYERTNIDLAEELSGLLFSDRQEIAELRAQIARSDGYSDELRLKLQNYAKAADAAADQQELTEIALTDALRNSAALAEEIGIEKLRSSERQTQIDKLTEEFELASQKIQAELHAARKAIADYEKENAELGSGLFDSQSFRQALELQLERKEESTDKQIRAFRHKIRRLERQREEDLCKIADKDNAIASLLNELANPGSIGQSAVDIGQTDDEQQDAGTESRVDDKASGDRITRLLIGRIGEQELRFPLFKDRLTIGRTSQNDIQLKAQYVSRRHALIVTENERIKIVDWGSRNGIFVNKNQVSEHFLKNGDVVTIGTSDFRFEERPKR